MDKWLQLGLVIAGAAVGAALRFLIVNILSVFNGPWPVMVVNILGCLAYGWLAPAAMPPAWRLALLTGVLGGFTTFSSYIHDAHQSPGSVWLWLALSPLSGYASYLVGTWLQQKSA